MGISKIYYVTSDSYDPYYNLALEERLLEICGENDLIFYLWQNDNTVVIGKNQSAYKECNIEEMKKDNVKLARRLSGGGAVYHDLGNLNFTFVTKRCNYDLNRQLTVIKDAINKNGSFAYFSGRNDILINEKKISGNAFYVTTDSCYHHGTLLVNSKLDMFGKYLKASKSKLESKGVDSVRSRVENINSFVKGLDIETLKKDLLEALTKVYWLPYEQLVVDNINKEKNEDPNWLYRKELESDYSLSNRFSWGELYFKLVIKEGIIVNLTVFSDSMDIEISEIIEKVMINSSFDTSLLEKFDILDDPYKTDLKQFLTGVING